jgi:hypothetical protein
LIAAIAMRKETTSERISARARWSAGKTDAPERLAALGGPAEGAAEIRGDQEPLRNRLARNIDTRASIAS